MCGVVGGGNGGGGGGTSDSLLPPPFCRDIADESAIILLRAYCSTGLRSPKYKSFYFTRALAPLAYIVRSGANFLLSAKPETSAPAAPVPAPADEPPIQNL